MTIRPIRGSSPLLHGPASRNSPAGPGEGAGGGAPQTRGGDPEARVPPPDAHPHRRRALVLIGIALRNRPVRLAIGGYLGHMWELYAAWTAAVPSRVSRQQDQD